MNADEALTSIFILFRVFFGYLLNNLVYFHNSLSNYYTGTGVILLVTAELDNSIFQAFLPETIILTDTGNFKKQQMILNINDSAPGRCDLKYFCLFRSGRERSQLSAAATSVMNNL